MDGKNKINLLITAVYESVEKVGINKTIEHLTSNKTYQTSQKVQHIIDVICDELEIDYDFVLNSRSRGKRMTAVMLINYFLRKKYAITFKEIESKTGVKKCNLSVYYKKMCTLDSKVRDEKELIDLMKNIEYKLS